MTRIAIVVGHARRDTYCEALAKAYRRGAEGAGHVVELHVLSKMTFDPILHNGFKSAQTLEPDLQAAQDAIGRANHLVLIFPLWMGTMPAILKGFLERVLQPGFAMAVDDGYTRYKPLLKGKSARVIITMAAPALVYRWWLGAHTLKALKNSILGFVGIRPVRSTILGMVDITTDAKRHRWLDEVEGLGRGAR